MTLLGRGRDFAITLGDRLGVVEVVSESRRERGDLGV